MRSAVHLVILLLAALTCGCGSYHETYGDSDNGFSSGGFTTLGFASITAMVFQPNRCLDCHSTPGGNQDGINLETYANVLPLIGKIQQQVVSGAMPLPATGLPPARPAEKAMLNAWVENGAPETSQIPIN